MHNRFLCCILLKITAIFLLSTTPLNAIGESQVSACFHIGNQLKQLGWYYYTGNIPRVIGSGIPETYVFARVFLFRKMIGFFIIETRETKCSLFKL